ncbi:hypothetical protein OO006_13975 [Prosthecochloris sp. SCSIO W1101]|nr:hypothetical protein [Prosthecochloris sp. SCSIO W1101]UZJ41426.1 hypothetical protein OO006_13975 [Prosthecochloris sp. SCSIO W1101]
MLKNITLSADEELIRKAREKAQREQTTLNASFRKWLRQYVNAEARARDFDELMQSLAYVRPGRKFSREEMNER